MKTDDIKQRWADLLYPKRFRPSRVKGKTEYKNKSYNRNPFDSDYLRVALSPPFRRLQDKAQVFPLEQNDFSRTRLTHSIEVSGLGRSIGSSIENILLEKKYLKEENAGHIPSILSVAGLVHDIGNPPFGHFGEKAIQSYFKTLNKKKSKKGLLSKEEKADFENFDGNVQGLRLLLRLGTSDDEYSFNLTLPVLSSIIKYPKSSIVGNEKKWRTKGIEFKKFGYFQSEKDRFDEINNFFNLNYNRHPLAFILEAADDIGYSVSDIEDGVKKKLITSDIILDLLNSRSFSIDENCKKLYEALDVYRRRLKEEKFPIIDVLIAQECRVKAQSIMIQDVVKVFIDNQADILCGNYGKELIKSSGSNKLREFFEKIAGYNFESEDVVKNELVGEKIITTLLDCFVNAVLSSEKEKNGTTEGKLYSIISNHYKFVNDKYNSYGNTTYKGLQLVTDYISGMTDSYALTLYQELTGIRLV